MTVPKPISLNKPLDLFDQRRSGISHLSKKEIEEIHVSATHYPGDKKSEFKADEGADRSLKESKNAHLDPKKSSSLHEKQQNGVQKQQSRLSGKGERVSLSRSIKSKEESEQDDLHFYQDQAELAESSVGEGSLSDSRLHHEKLPSTSSVVAGMAGLLSQVKSFFQPQQPLLSEGEDLSLTASTETLPILNPRGIELEKSFVSGLEMVNADDSLLKKVEPEVVHVDSKIKENLNMVGHTLSNSEMIHDLDIVDMGVQEDKKEAHLSDDKLAGNEVTTFAEQRNIFSKSDLENRDSFARSQQEHSHEIASKIGEKESEGNSLNVAKPLFSHVEVASVSGSANLAEPQVDHSIAAALRVTHLLDELTATVGRLRLERSDGKEMTIQLRPDVLAETNIHIVSTSKQIEVSFLTSNAGSNLLLNNHLNILQNHLNTLCPGQVVNVQTQLLPSSESSQLGHEQDSSRDDLASFNQGNRGNLNNDDDSL